MVTDAYNITPSDDPLDPYPTAIWVGGTLLGAGGTIDITTRDGTRLTITAPAGSMLPIQVTHIHATGTTAQNLTALI